MKKIASLLLTLAVTACAIALRALPGAGAKYTSQGETDHAETTLIYSNVTMVRSPNTYFTTQLATNPTYYGYTGAFITVKTGVNDGWYAVYLKGGQGGDGNGNGYRNGGRGGAGGVVRGYAWLDEGKYFLSAGSQGRSTGGGGNANTRAWSMFGKGGAARNNNSGGGGGASSIHKLGNSVGSVWSAPTRSNLIAIAGGGGGGSSSGNSSTPYDTINVGGNGGVVAGATTGAVAGGNARHPTNNNGTDFTAYDGNTGQNGGGGGAAGGGTGRGGSASGSSDDTNYGNGGNAAYDGGGGGGGWWGGGAGGGDSGTWADGAGGGGSSYLRNNTAVTGKASLPWDAATNVVAAAVKTYADTMIMKHLGSRVHPPNGRSDWNSLTWCYLPQPDYLPCIILVYLGPESLTSLTINTP